MVDGVAQPVQRLYAPMPPDHGGEQLRCGAGGGQVGHPERGDRREGGAGGVGDVAFDQPCLVEVGKGQVGRRGQDLDGARGDSAVAVGVGGTAHRLAVNRDRDQRRVGSSPVFSQVALSPAVLSPAAACSTSQAPTTAAESTPVTTRQMVAFDGGPGAGSLRWP